MPSRRQAHVNPARPPKTSSLTDTGINTRRTLSHDARMMALRLAPAVGVSPTFFVGCIKRLHLSRQSPGGTPVSRLSSALPCLYRSFVAVLRPVPWRAVVVAIGVGEGAMVVPAKLFIVPCLSGKSVAAPFATRWRSTVCSFSPVLLFSAKSSKRAVFGADPRSIEFTRRWVKSVTSGLVTRCSRVHRQSRHRT